MMLRRCPPLPSALHDAWWAFVTCAEVVEVGRRHLLATLPAGRVEPVPVEAGLGAMSRAIDDARAGMCDWRLSELGDAWAHCLSALDAAAEAVTDAYEVAATADELEDLLHSVGAVIEPLAAFADAERTWRRRWRVPPEGLSPPGRRLGPWSRVDDAS